MVQHATLNLYGVGAKISMNSTNESNRNFNDHFMNNSYNITEKHSKAISIEKLSLITVEIVETREGCLINM